MLRKDNDLLRYINKKNKDTRCTVMARYKSRIDATKQIGSLYGLSMARISNGLFEFRKLLEEQESKIVFFPE